MEPENQYELVLVNDDKVSGFHVHFSVRHYFPDLPNELLLKIIDEVERFGEAPVLVGSIEECKKALKNFEEDGIPAKIRAIKLV